MASTPCGLLPIERLQEYAAKPSKPEGFEEVVQHLEVCSECREYVSDQLDHIATAVATNLDPGLSAGHPNFLTTERRDSAEPATRQDVSHWAELEILDPPSSDGAIGGLSKYDVLEVRGRGGMGVVVKGFDRQLKRVVAIKLMSRRLMESDKSLKRFEREAILAASISHPNVVTIHGVESHRGVPFIVMEYVEGLTLAQRIAVRGNLSIAETIRMSSQIASGLAAAHARGVIHRDIKPGNIMLEDGIQRVKITDFGLARIAQENSDLTSLGEALGTPAFMSPEQVDGTELTTSTDLFSFACVIYAMVTGRSPFVGGHQLKIVQRIANEHPPPLDKLDPAVPRGFAVMVTRMLEKDPRQRTITAAEIESRLNADLLTLMHADSGVVTVPVDAMPPKRRSIARRAAVAAAIGLAAWLGVSSVWRQQPSGDGNSGTDTVSMGSDEPAPVSVSEPEAPVDYAAERELARHIVQLGGTVVVGTSYILGTKAATLEDLPQEDFFITDINLSNLPAVTDADVEPMSRLSRLSYLQLQGTGITDRSLETIGQFKLLSYLGIGKTTITDAGLPFLSGLDNLARLNLQAAPVTFTGIQSLASLSKLDSLYLNDTQLDDQAFGEIASLERLKRLELCRTRLTAASFDALAGLRSLEELHLTAATTTTDATLSPLASLTQLKVLNLRDVAVDPATLDHLRESLPNCRILR